MKILIDNGHGVNTPGKCSPDKRLLEYKWAREIATKLVDRLKSLGYDSERIVTEEIDISLKERCNRVNKICKKLGNKNVILISIHCNAGDHGNWCNATGWEAFVSKNASDNSKKLARSLYEECEKLELQGNRSIPKEKYWQANFYIIKNTLCPAVLTENLFMDNKENLEYLLSDKGKEDIITLHTKGIINYIKSL